jgi:hypothetical protein
MKSKWWLVTVALIGAVVSGVIVWRSLGLSGSSEDAAPFPDVTQTADATAPPTAPATAPVTAAATTAQASVPSAAATVPVVAVTIATDVPAVQTFTLVGGLAEVSYEGGVVAVVAATPAVGFTAEVEPEGPGWKVEFRSDAHRSRIDVWWDGALRHTVEERAD